MAFELIADGRADEIGAVRIKSVLHHEIDVARVDIAEIVIFSVSEFMTPDR
jgi:hypothetical protein